MSHPKKSRGFTLIEVMIVVGIIGLLTTIAYPSYREHIQRSQRTVAKTALLELATRQERFFTVNNRYTTVGTDLGYASNFPIGVGGDGNALYRITVTTANATGFAATATPVGGATADACGVFAISQSGQQSNTSNTLATARCW